jgi:acyl-coenzyme A synthetase/AMP-(fatty) acid ligase
MNHTDGWQRVSSALYAGASLIIYEGLLSVAGWIDDVQRFKISSFYTPPPFLHHLLKADHNDIKEMTTTLRSIEIGSAPVSPDRINQLANLFPGVTIYVHFGLTESSRATLLNATARSDKLHTVGTACPNVEIAIRDDQGKIQTRSGKGEILLRGMQSSRYYWQRDDLNQQRILQDWLLTGDYGELDSDGYLLYQGRKDDMINFSGFHYFPAEAELELKQVPGVERYVFCGIPDEHGIHQHLPCAFFQPEPGAQVADAGRTLLTLSRQHLLPHMVPRKVIPVTEIALTSSGKPNRRQLIKDYLYQIDEQLK